MDLLSILPSFPTKPYTHILPPLERNNIDTVDLITLDTLEIAKRARVPPTDVRRLAAQITDALHRDVGLERDVSGGHGEDGPGDTQASSSFNQDVGLVPGERSRLGLSRWCAMSTLDPGMDRLLDGGIPAGYVTEVTGESGSGKTQFLLNLLLSVQLPPPKGLSKRAIYISTEAPLATARLSQYLQSHPYLSSLPRGQKPSLQNILSINAMDLETQDHILNYQLPVAITRYHVGLVVIDSITANFRAEHTSHDVNALSTRSGELAKLGQMLRNLAAQEDIAVVVANQVSDRFDSMDTYPYHHHPLRMAGPPSTTGTRPSDIASPIPKPRPKPAAESSNNIELLQPPPHIHTTPPTSSPAFPSSPLPFLAEEDPQFDGSYLVGNSKRNETLSLLHQQRFFTGWGDERYALHRGTPKIPALGFVWTTQIACRIALKKDEIAKEGGYDNGFAGTQGDAYPGMEGQGQSESREGRETPSTDDQPATSTAAGPDEQRTDDPNTATTKPQTAPKTEARQPATPAPIVDKPLKRTMKLVFAPWTAGSVNTTDTDAGPGSINDEIEFEFWEGGLRTVRHGQHQE